MRRFNLAAGLALLATGAAPALAAPAPGNYSYVVFTVPGANSGTFGVAINASGTVAGYYKVGMMLETFKYGFTRSPDGTVTSIIPSGSSTVTVTGIADDGTVIGSYVGFDGFDKGFTFKGGQYHTFQQPQTHIDLRAISPNGIVVGDSSTLTAYSNTQYAFYQGSARRIGLPNARAFASAVNNAGDIVGCYYHIDTGAMPYLFKSGSFIKLASRPDEASCPTAINGSGVIVGTSFNSDGATRAVVVSNGMAGTFQYPGSTETRATDINDAGAIVGSAVLAPSHNIGYVLKSGVFNTLITSDGEDVIPTSINRAGQIVGQSSLTTIIATPN